MGMTTKSKRFYSRQTEGAQHPETPLESTLLILPKRRDS